MKWENVRLDERTSTEHMARWLEDLARGVADDVASLGESAVTMNLSFCADRLRVLYYSATPADPEPRPEDATPAAKERPQCPVCASRFVASIEEHGATLVRCLSCLALVSIPVAVDTKPPPSGK